jgi:hypothetical protein
MSKSGVRCKHKWQIYEMEYQGQDDWFVNLKCRWCNMVVIGNLQTFVCESCGGTNHHDGECEA